MKNFMKSVGLMAVLGASYGAAIVTVGKMIDKFGTWIKSRKEEEF